MLQMINFGAKNGPVGRNGFCKNAIFFNCMQLPVSFYAIRAGVNLKQGKFETN